MPTAALRLPKAALVKACQDITCSRHGFTLRLVPPNVVTHALQQADNSPGFSRRQTGFGMHIQAVLGFSLPLIFISHHNTYSQP
jgi:hypothetical protein